LVGLVLGAIAVFVIDRKFINASAFALAGAVMTFSLHARRGDRHRRADLASTPSVCLAY